MKEEKNKTVGAGLPDYGDAFGQLQSEPKKRGHVFRNILITLAVLIVILAIALVTAINLALQTGDLQKFSAQPDDALIHTLLQSVLFGQEKDITDDELNAFLAFTFQSYDAYLAQAQIPPAQIRMDALAVYFHADRPSEIYARLIYGEQVLVLSAQADIGLDTDKKQFYIEVTESKIGNLPVPADWVLDVLFQNEAVKAVSDRLSHNGSTVYVPASWTTQVMSTDVSFEIKTFNIKEKSAAVQTTSAIKALQDLLGGIFR